MSWGFVLCMTSVTFMVCLDESLCELLGGKEQLVIPQGQDGDRMNTSNSIVGYRTTVNNITAVGLQESRDIGSGGGNNNHGAHGGDNSNHGAHGGESHMRKKNKQEKGFMEKMLPMMVIPFLVSSSMIPMMLVSLKLMMLKSAFIGKIAILLMLLNMFRRRTSGEGGVFSHNINANDVAMEHYGYHGDEEYGAYVN